MAYGMGSGLAGSGTVGQLAGQAVSAASFAASGTSTALKFVSTATGSATGLDLSAGGSIALNFGSSLISSSSLTLQPTASGWVANTAFVGTALNVSGAVNSSGAANAIGTPASGTGITVGYNGDIRRSIFKITTTFAAWSAAALFLDITFGVLPAKARLVSVIADTTVAYVLGGGTIVLTVGKTAGGAEYIASHDIKTAAVTKGLADADMGTLLTRAAAIQGGDLAAAMWTGSTNLQGRITSSAGNLSTMSAGSTTFYFIIEYF